MGTYRSPSVIKSPVAGAIAKTAESVGQSAAEYVTTVENKRKLQQLADNKANEDLYGVSKSINDIPTADDTKFDEEFKNMLKERMDKLYVMGREVARGGDNTEYLRLKAETESLAASIPNLIESINYNANMLDQGFETGKQPLATTDANFAEFLQKWNNEGGSGVTPSIVNGKLVLTGSNGYMVNTDAVLKSSEKGGGVRFVENPMDELKVIFEAAGGDDLKLYSQLNSSTREEAMKLITEKEVDFTAANKRILSYFEIDDDKIGTAEDPLQAELNQNNYQFFIKKDGTYNAETSKKELREAIIARIKKDFMHDDIINKGKSVTPVKKTGSEETTVEIGESKALKALNDEASKVVELVGNVGYVGAEEVKDDPKTKNVNEAKAAVPSMIEQISNSLIKDGYKSATKEKLEKSNVDEYLAMKELVQFANSRTMVESFTVGYDPKSNMFRIYQTEDNKKIILNINNVSDVKSFINSVTPDNEKKVDLTKSSSVKFN